MERRLRSMKDVDLSRAKPGCKRCNGRGITGYKHATPEELKAGAPERMPIVCRCVVKRGGVRQDLYDRQIAAKLSQEMSKRSFAESAAKQILSGPKRDEAIQRLKNRIDKVGDRDVRAALERTLEIAEGKIEEERREKFVRRWECPDCGERLVAVAAREIDESYGESEKARACPGCGFKFYLEEDNRS